MCVRGVRHVLELGMTNSGNFMVLAVWAVLEIG